MSASLVYFIPDIDLAMLNYDQIRLYRADAVDGTYALLGAKTQALESGKRLYTFQDAEGGEDKWYKYTLYNSSTLNESDLSYARNGASVEYCNIQDLRDEGLTAAAADDNRVRKAIGLATRYIERITGNWFYPRERTFILDGIGKNVQFLRHPIVMIEETKILSDLNDEFLTIETPDLYVYNRHLTQGLLSPDDRNSPRIEIRDFSTAAFYYFAKGKQNVQVKGIFGWTELQPGAYAGETEEGSQIPVNYGTVPDLIRHAAVLLSLREIALKTDLDELEDWRKRWAVTQQKTEDQTITFGTQALTAKGAYTGDSEIDDILDAHSVPTMVGSI